MPTPPASVADFKAFFVRDWVYGTGTEFVMDSDIQRGIDSAMPLFNAELWTTSEIKLAFLYAAAYFMVASVQAAGGLSAIRQSLGTKNRGGAAIGSATAGSLSVNYVGLERQVEKWPSLAFFLRNDYGCFYLQMLLPRLAGAVAVVDGPRDPDAVVPNIPFMAP